MAWGPWDIADGQLSSTPASTIHSVTVTGVLGEVLLTNTHSTAVTCNIYVNRSGSDRRIGGKDMEIPAGGYRRLSLAVALLNGDIIKGDASVNNVVDHVFSGVKNA
jgi:hypothetical protein